MRCGTEKETKNVTVVRYPNQRQAERGECAHCGTRTSKFVKAGA
jgi:hypothetical protein